LKQDLPPRSCLGHIAAENCSRFTQLVDHSVEIIRHDYELAPPAWLRITSCLTRLTHSSGSLHCSTRKVSSARLAPGWGGCKEVRRCWAFDTGEKLYQAEQWRDLASFAVVERTRTVAGKTTVGRRHYIPLEAAQRSDAPIRWIICRLAPLTAERP
jgi:hypothetical protein